MAVFRGPKGRGPGSSCCVVPVSVSPDPGLKMVQPKTSGLSVDISATIKEASDTACNPKTPTSSVLKSSNGRTSITPRETKSSRLRKSLGSAGSPQSVTSGAPHSRSHTPEVNSSGLAYEMTRLRDEARAKQHEVEALSAELTTVNAAVATKNRALTAAQASIDALTHRALTAEADLAARSKELADVSAERNKARSEAAAAGRAADKLTAQIAAMPKGSGFSEVIAALESELKSVRASNAALADDNKGCYSLIRAKDKELDAAAAQVEAAKAIAVENKELQNSILDLSRRLKEAADERATMTAVARQREAEVARCQAEAAAAAEAAAERSRQLAVTTTELKASQEREAELADELALLNDELTRVRAVAARATVREIAGGAKDEGVVPIKMHLEEVRYLQGQNDRLKEKLSQAERSAAAASAQKERLHKKLDTLAASTSPPRKPTIAGGNEVAALRASLAAREEEAAALREQVEKAGPRVAAMRAACKKHERDIAALCAQLAAAGLQPVLAPASARPKSGSRDSSVAPVVPAITPSKPSQVQPSVETDEVEILLPAGAIASSVC
ncbi:probable microtubule-associated protein [Coccomyxa sp. Obi]|nr:probable microtubule-associated protein [Coccomyxa sp. Obi]